MRFNYYSNINSLYMRGYPAPLNHNRLNNKIQKTNRDKQNYVI